MANGVDACSKKGLHATNVKELILKNVVIKGNVGDDIELAGVDKLEQD